jgi:hypothetical protein
MILLAGDCTGSAYIFTPSTETIGGTGAIETADCGTEHPLPQYDLAFEIECGATVSTSASGCVVS